MANLVLVMGESGTGKSTSIQNLNPAETFIFSILDKPLPFRGYKNNYRKIEKKDKVTAENTDSVEPPKNMYVTDSSESIVRTLIHISSSKPYIKNIIIDDFQYLMSNEFMRRAKERGFDKFTEIAQSAWNSIFTANQCRDDLDIFILTHTEYDSSGVYKCKTIGKMLDEKIVLEGMFTVVLHSVVTDCKYKFITQHDGCHIAKSPRGMFDDLLIENDLAYVKSKMKQYYEGE